MPSASASVQTEKAQRYLAQLCKHFAHKVQVDWSETEGVAHFPPGVCRMRAEADSLELVCESGSAEGLATTKAIVEDHVVRFGWKEELTVNWREANATE